MNWYVYIAEAKSGKYYTGISTDPKKRIIRHNSKRGSQMAQQQGPFHVVYVSEIFDTRSKAQIREYQLKGWSRVKKEKLVEGVRK